MSLRFNYIMPFGLGAVQLVNWGTLYYSIAVIAQPLSTALSLSKTSTFGGVSLALLVSGLLTPAIGRLIDEKGARPLLMLGSLMAALAMIFLALSSGPLTYFAAWAVVGVAMSLSLYDPAFSLLHQTIPRRYGEAVAIVTLIGGFASTVFWPLTHWLISIAGWRNTLLLFAALHIIIATPVYVLMVPARRVLHAVTRDSASQPNNVFKAQGTLNCITLAFALAAGIFAVLSVFLIDIFRYRGFTPADAVLLAATIGPMQVAGRLVELACSRKRSAYVGGSIALSLLLCALVILNFLPPVWLWGLLFTSAYGFANGVVTITRPVVVVELLRLQLVGNVLGRVARPAYFARALAPILIGWGLEKGIGYPWIIPGLIVCACIILVSYWQARKLAQKI